MVSNDHVWLYPSWFPTSSQAKYEIVTSNIWFWMRGRSGVKVIVSPTQLNVPLTKGDIEKACSTAVMFMVSLKVTEMVVSNGTLVEPSSGETLSMVGNLVSKNITNSQLQSS